MLSRREARVCIWFVVTVIVALCSSYYNIVWLMAIGILLSIGTARVIYVFHRQEDRRFDKMREMC